MTGSTWVEESGFLEGPVMLTNTHSVGVVRDAVVDWQYQNGLFASLEGLPGMSWSLPVVAETFDGLLNDINGFHVTREHAVAALESASDGAVGEGNVGGGTGMNCHQFKGGIGTASRTIQERGAAYTLGVLVQANYGGRETLQICGVPVGKEITDLRPEWSFGEPPEDQVRSSGQGSIVVVVATDAPLLPHQLKRIARRVPLGVAKMGGYGENSSGDIFIAFSTANPHSWSPSDVTHPEMLPNDRMDGLFLSTVQATEEAIVNALVAAETMEGINGNTSHALPHDRLRVAMKKYGR